MTKEEALKLALEALEEFGEHYDWCHQFPTYAFPENYPPCNCGYDKAITAVKEALAQPEQEPVVMKFKIYKPTVPDPMRQGINNALLPWVYDQDRNSGFDATMWVTPVATLPPQRKPLTDEEIILIVAECAASHQHTDIHFARAIERAHGIKELV